MLAGKESFYRNGSSCRAVAAAAAVPFQNFSTFSRNEKIFNISFLIFKIICCCFEWMKGYSIFREKAYIMFAKNWTKFSFVIFFCSKKKSKIKFWNNLFLLWLRINENSFWKENNQMPFQTSNKKTTGAVFKTLHFLQGPKMFLLAKWIEKYWLPCLVGGDW